MYYLYISQRNTNLTLLTLYPTYIAVLFELTVNQYMYLCDLCRGFECIDKFCETLRKPKRSLSFLIELLFSL